MISGLFLPVWLAAAFLAAAEPPKPACALLKACGLETAVPGCTAGQSRPLDGVVYDAARCDEPRDLLAHGVIPAQGIGVFVYPFLGGRYRVVYDIRGEAPISEARFNYLAGNLPLAARLATRFSRTRYLLEYVDTERKRFRASRADKLTGEAEFLFSEDEGRRRTCYGWGASKFGPWKLRGSAYLDVRVRSIPSGIAYEVKVRAAPANALINAIMGLGLFRGYVLGQIEETMKDLTGAAAALSPGSLEKILADPAFNEGERAQVRALAALP